MRARALAALLLCSYFTVFPPHGGPPRICTTCCAPDGTGCTTVCT